MRLGFVILAHRDLNRVAELVRHLAQEDCAVAVHIDRNVPNSEFERLNSDFAKTENVVFSPRTHCEWGRFSLVQATLDASEALLNRFPDVSNVLLISGSCLPIRPIRQLKRFLKRNAGTDYIESVSVANNYWVKDGLNEERFTYYFPFSWRKQRKLFDGLVKLQRRFKIRRKIPAPLVPHIGSQWWCLTARTLRAILNDPKRPYYDNYFSWTWIPDESYFQTLARVHSDTVESRSLTFSKFDYLGKPFVFYDDHLKEMTQSDCFLARKIWSGADRLYATLLDPKRANQPMSQADPKAFDAKFDQADKLRCEGGTGRFYQGRFPYDKAERAGVSGAPFSVFVGVKDLFPTFTDWVETKTGAMGYGSVFSRTKVGALAPDQHYPGNLPAEPKIRNRNPKGYLANLLWHHQDQHQFLLYDFRDNTRILRTLATDPQAHVVVIKHAWLLTLLRRNGSFANMLATAKRFQRLEEGFLREFAKANTQAQLETVSLQHAIERPAQFLEQAIAHIPHESQSALQVMPERATVDGLDKLVKRLRNNGLRLDYEPAARGKGKKQQETVFEKPYVVK